MNTMNEEIRVKTYNKRDAGRQAANVIGALFQIGATIIASAKIQEVVDEGPPSLVEPAGYAFAIWLLIFTLSLAYAIYQALPANRENPLLRRVGWFTAGAFACTGLWSVFVPERQLLLALAMLLVVFTCLAVVYLRFARDDARQGRRPGRSERWLAALPVGIFLGWITAAITVSINSELIRFGVVSAGGAGEVLLGTALLLLGGALAAAVVMVGRSGPVQGYLAYGGTVLWALVAVVVNQYDASILTTSAAVVAAVPVTLALFGRLPGSRPRPGEGHAVQHNVAT